MIIELAHFALILALLVALLLGTLPLIGAQKQKAAWMQLAAPATYALTLLVTLSMAGLAWGFYKDDFSVKYVAQHSNFDLPTMYKLAAVWGGHEGSLLLWVWLLTGWSSAVALCRRSLPAILSARVLSVLGLVNFGFLTFVLTTSSPFTRLLPAAAAGRDLNPLLQDPGMVFHPPLLYMGYVGFAIVFAFAIAALIAGELDLAWIRWVRPWTLAAWICLTMGIALGSWWAYNELGWGGWWFWDPVENSSFMPWLIGTALLHSLAVTEKRGVFRHWTLLLAIASFSLSLLGTFLVRSGVLTSVHAFASDPRRGIFILLFLTIVIGSSLALFAWRAPQLKKGGNFSLLSRETLLLLNNVILVVVCASVLLGTLYPLLAEALGLGKLSVGPPYFNTVFVPLMLPLILLVAPGSIAQWRKASFSSLARPLAIPLLLAILIAFGVPPLLGEHSWMASLGLFLAAWTGFSVLTQIAQAVLQKRWPERAWWGMQIAHLGLAIFIAGVSVVKNYEIEREVRMLPGDTATLSGNVFRLRGISASEGPNYSAQRGEVEVLRGGKVIAVLHPEKRTYFSTPMPMTEAAIDSNLLQDLYVSLGEPLDGEAWSVRIYVKPLIGWLWGGSLVMALGGAIALIDRRYRREKKAAEEVMTAEPATMETGA